jgi:hypothetical protein
MMNGHVATATPAPPTMLVPISSRRRDLSSVAAAIPISLLLALRVRKAMDYTGFARRAGSVDSENAPIVLSNQGLAGLY